eukprot:TRINITY_DN4369_c0_g1_i2.p1 TRINITY_DN4369_c0_g1~~TRINITY_DN4369_c0_g1_i2.p1  ORF type:complete len:306 (-),score=59.57 TRINITY_DN4369_c0_g1_i2:579-1496(-)
MTTSYSEFLALNQNVAPTLLNYFGQTRGTLIDVPTDDELVKARLIELREPIICFGESNVDRRNRLIRILEDRGITQGMPTTVKKKADQPKTMITQDEVDQAFFYQPDPELGDKIKDARKWILEYSMERARKRLAKAKDVRREYEEKWEWHQEQTQNMKSHFKNFSISNSTVGDETRPLSSVNFSPCGEYIATSSWSGLCKLWHLDTSTEVRALQGHTERAQFIDFYPEARAIDSEELAMVSCGADSKIHFWSMSSEEPLAVLEGHTDCVNRIAFHPSNRFLGSTSHDKSWSFWDIETVMKIFDFV